MQSIPQPRRTYLILYLLFGLILSLLFVALASVIALMAAGAVLSWDNLVQLHLNDPLFVLIDLFAVVMVVTFGFLGSQRDKTTHAKAQLQWLNQKRSSDLQEMKDQMIAQDEKYSGLEAIISRGKQQWVATFDAVRDLVVLTDENGIIMRCNRATGEAFRTGFSQIIGRQINELFLGRQAAENVSDDYLAEKPEIHFPRLNGWYQVSRNFLIIDGQQNGWVYVFRDISDRRQDMQELQRLNEYYQQLVINSPIAIATLTLEDRIVDVNPAFKKLFGYEQGEVLGWNLDALICPAAFAAEMHAITEFVGRGETVHHITQRKHKDGDLIEVEVFGIPVILGGKQIGSLRLYHDVSGLVSNQREALATAPFVDGGWSLEEELPSAEIVTAEIVREEIPEEQAADDLAGSDEPDIIAVEETSTGQAAEPGEQVAPDEQVAPGEPAEPAAEAKVPLIPRSLRIDKIEGIGPVYAQKLSGAGIYTTADLLNAGRTTKGRQDLSENLDISDRLVLKWVNMADLMRVKGIGEEYSQLLEQAGVDTVRELRHRQPENLHARLGEVNQEQHLVRRLPHLSEVENWIRLANELEPLVTY